MSRKKPVVSQTERADDIADRLSIERHDRITPGTEEFDIWMRSGFLWGEFKTLSQEDLQDLKLVQVAINEDRARASDS